MKYLLDTMVWIWSLGETEKIGREGLEILKKGESEVYLSAASSWEIIVKVRLGKFRLPEAPPRYIPKRLAEQGIQPLSVTLNHSLRVYDLPPHHHDPFDRMIIAQALAEKMVVLTSDRVFGKYPTEVVWCGT